TLRNDPMSENDPQPTDPQPAPTAGQVTISEDDLKKLREERDKYLDLLQRTRADFLNFQRKAQRDSEEAQTYAIAKFARSLLEVVDNLSRAALLGDSPGDQKALRSGVDLVLQLLLKTLADNKVVAIETVGKPFDPQQHEAIMQEPRDDVPPLTVIDELVRGYAIADRLLRPAVVRVSKAKEPAAAPPAADKREKTDSAEE
ncbi:MAG: nucleotide exchange factor GrpE, partial [Planctomycetota bacterium]